VTREPDVAEPPFAAAEVERDAPVGALPVRAPRPPLVSGVVSAVAGEVVEVVVVSHVRTGDVVSTVAVVVDVVVEGESTGAVSAGLVSADVVSTGVASTTVVVEVVGGDVAGGAVGSAQSSTRSPEDKAFVLAAPFVCCPLVEGTDVVGDVDAEAEGVVLELV
jgi:hypothetical protein